MFTSLLWLLKKINSPRDLLGYLEILLRLLIGSTSNTIWTQPIPTYTHHLATCPPPADHQAMAQVGIRTTTMLTATICRPLARTTGTRSADRHPATAHARAAHTPTQGPHEPRNVTDTMMTSLAHEGLMPKTGIPASMTRRTQGHDAPAERSPSPSRTGPTGHSDDDTVRCSLSTSLMTRRPGIS